jgi:Poxvirus A32 protein
MKKSLQVKPIPIPSDANHPSPPDPRLPKHEFSMGFIAPKGSGKTTTLINLTSFYRGYFNKIIVFSPTVRNDEKWDWLRKQKILGENKSLKKFIAVLAAKEREKDQVVHNAPNDTFNDFLEQEFDPYISDDCFIDTYDENTLNSILAQQQQMIDLLKSKGKTKHIADRILIIFDDLVGSKLFSGKSSNPFKKLNTNHRHYSISMLMVTQAYKEIPKTCRTQFSCLIVFEIPNDRETRVIYEENPMGLKMDDWYRVYNYATEGDHDFLFINYQQPRPLRIMKNFDQVISIK